jgi:hypothetical protein
VFKTFRRWGVAIVGLVLVFTAFPAAGMQIEGYWCDLVQYSLIRDGAVVATWTMQENCTAQYGQDPSLTGGGGDAPLDPFDGCQDTCGSPCKVYSACSLTCGAISSCTGCCGIWRDTANKARGCRLRCQSLTEEARGLCVADCKTQFNQT